MFPTSVTVKPPHFNLTRLNMFNKDLNREQVAAVRHIIEAKARPLPYLLFGPPGRLRGQTRQTENFLVRPPGRFIVLYLNVL